MSNSNTFDKLSILDSFIEEVDSYLPEIEANLETLAQDVQVGQPTRNMDVIEETYRRTHTIGGSASMMDLFGLAHVAQGMEDILGDVYEELVVPDAPMVALLQRSLGRVRILLGGVRGGIDANAIVAEDDSDYEQYRVHLEQVQNIQNTPDAVAATLEIGRSNIPTSPIPPTFDTARRDETAQSPSFDEVLASFRTPSFEDSGDIDWPEEYSQDDEQTDKNSFAVLPTLDVPTPVDTFPSDEFISKVPSSSALEELVASTSTGQVVNNYPVPTEQGQQLELHAPARLNAELKSSMPLPVVYEELQQEAQSLEQQSTSIQSLVAQLRSAMIVIEEQRSEFKGFLDGSKDALDRMEEWAGKAMGLNLRNSPEQVRKYLPLSVMWVANTKLKKVLELLNQIMNGAELTDEQLRNIFEQLRLSIASCVDEFYRARNSSAYTLAQEEGWSPWKIRTSSTPELGVQERVTFERSGNLNDIREQVREELRKEIESDVRQELEQEYKPISLASRAELEQKIRNEVRQELEANRQLQEQVAGTDISLLRQELERQLRNDIEIQVRQEFLDHIAMSNSDTSRIVEQGTPTTSDHEFTSRSFSTEKQNALHDELAVRSLLSSTDASNMVASPTVSSTSAMSSDFAETSEVFRVEAEELLQTISTNVTALEREPTNSEYIQGIRRAMHTLKGAAGMMGFRTIAELSHVSEDLLDSIMEGKTSISPQVLSIILDTDETLEALIADDFEENAEGQRVQSLHVRYAQLLGEKDAREDLEGTEDEKDKEHIPNVSLTHEAPVPSYQSVDMGVQPASSHDLSVRVNLQKLDELVNLFGELLVNRSVLEERIQRLVRLVADVGISSNRLRDVGQRLESRFEAATLPSGRSVVVMPGEGETSDSTYRGNRGIEPSHLADFDELELDRYTEFHRLARGLSEGISDMSTLSAEMDGIIRECESVFARENRLSTTFQDRLMKTRLVPLSTMVPRLDRAARAVAFRQQKEFEFTVEGGETEVDRTVYEEIAGPLLHLMRNAVNHAIETPEVRVQQGKSPRGHITLEASYESNLIVVTVRDDGSGINPERIREVALSRGLIQPDQVLSESEVIGLIFRPGFSTAEVVSEESGRGIGLDVVYDSVSRLRGSIEVESMPGQGTAFTMRFPTSMAIQSAMMVMVGGQQFAIPTVMIESIGRLDTFKRTTGEGQPAIIVRDELYPLHMLSQYLKLSTGQITEKSHILLVNTGGNRVALVIDEVKGKSDVVVKNLGPHLRHVYGITGATVLGNGQVVLILELSELLSTRNRLMSTSAKSGTTIRETGTTVLDPLISEQIARDPQPQLAQSPRVLSPTASSSKSWVETPSIAASDITRPSVNAGRTERGKYVLVVDDSPSVRRVVSNMLKQHGWDVQMARDGVEALELISRETPAAVLLDIEMPRMDGYELIATVRAQEQYRTLPLVVLTSRAATKHQQRAMQLGASGYVVKPYQDEELLNTLNSLVYGAAVHS